MGLVRTFASLYIVSMSRNIRVRGIILRTTRIGEIHKGVTILSFEQGLVEAIAHGAWKDKSKLRAATQLFSHSLFYLYSNPVKNSNKVSDIENYDLFEHLREGIKKYYIASLFAEVILKSYAGGEQGGSLFSLLLEFLTLLDLCGEKEEDYVLIQFLWRFTRLAGFQPDLKWCAGCGNEFSGGGAFHFKRNEAAFYCSSCAGSGGIIPGIRPYLLKTLEMKPVNALGVKISLEALKQLKMISLEMMEVLLETRLNTLKSGRGIL